MTPLKIIAPPKLLNRGLVPKYFILPYIVVILNL